MGCASDYRHMAHKVVVYPAMTGARSVVVVGGHPTTEVMEMQLAVGCVT
jgi:hypothetical protein